MERTPRPTMKRTKRPTNAPTSEPTQPPVGGGPTRPPAHRPTHGGGHRPTTAAPSPGIGGGGTGLTVAVYFAGNGLKTFSGGRLYDRPFLTGLCTKTAHEMLNLTCIDIFPVVGVSPSDSFTQCRDPVTRTVYDVGQVLGPKLEVLANGWQDLFAGIATAPLKESLGQASSLASQFFWSGLDQNGDAMPNKFRCDSWTSASPHASGETGNVQGVDAPFVGTPRGPHVESCDTELTYLCACVGPTKTSEGQ
jgi:hypothetical protein